jgi:flavin reductase (DIM6/NTAB) family NADH-FMN oxidoreductase RutF
MEKIKLANIPYGPYVAVIVGAAVDGRPNYTTVGAYGVVSQKAVLYVSLKNTHCTTKGIEKSGFFSVNIPSADLVEKTDFCGMVSGNDRDKSAVFTPYYDEAGNAPLIAECPINYLCKVVRTIPVFDFTMFLGEITAAYANSDCLNNKRPDGILTNPTILLDTGYYNLKEKVGTVFRSGRDLAEKQ